jgi:hypothetical protein
LAELVVVWVIGLVEDEWCFSKLTFMKTKLRNQLTVHLELVIWMFRPKFFIIENFPFGTRTQSWKDNKIRYGEWWKIYWILQLHFVSMIHTCLNGDSMNLHSTPFRAFKNQEWKLFFLHWLCVTKFSFVQGKPYATMGRAYLGRVQFPIPTLSPKVGMRKSMIRKRINFFWKLVV